MFVDEFDLDETTKIKKVVNLINVIILGMENLKYSDMIIQKVYLIVIKIFI